MDTNREPPVVRPLQEQRDIGIKVYTDPIERYIILGPYQVDSRIVIRWTKNDPQSFSARVVGTKSVILVRLAEEATYDQAWTAVQRWIETYKPKLEINHAG